MATVNRHSLREELDTLEAQLTKVKQKVSGCFRTRRFAEAYCRISSYLQTMAYQGYNPLVAIQITLSGRAAEFL